MGCFEDSHVLVLVFIQNPIALPFFSMPAERDILTMVDLGGAARAGRNAGGLGSGPAGPSIGCLGVFAGLECRSGAAALPRALKE